MPTIEELLAPIGGISPAGPNLRSSNDFAQVEGAFRSADELVVLSPSDEPEGLGNPYEAVIEPAQDFLKDQSKDLSVAAYLTASLLREGGFGGLAEGLTLVHGLLDRFWDGLHPGVESRAAVLEWLGSDDVSYAVSLVPLTELDPRCRYVEYKAWAKDQADGAQGAGPKGDEGEERSDFNGAFVQTPREWYVDLVTDLRRCTAAVKAIVDLGQERFKEADLKPPRLKPMIEALDRIEKAAGDLLSRKPGPPVPEMEEPLAEVVADVADADAGGGIKPVNPGLSEPKTSEEATDLVLLGARFLRRDLPLHPGSYAMVRGLRWGEMRAEGSHIDPRMLEAPSTAQRTHLKGLFLDQEFDALLQASEDIMATPVGRGWLDLQRYAVISAERLGKDYRHVRNVILKGTARFLQDLPELLEMTLMDDSPTASRDTLAWLEDEGLLPSQGSDGAEGDEVVKGKDPRKIIKEASFDRAAAMARSGDPEGAIGLLMERAEHEPSERGRFLTKSEAAAIMVDHGMIPIARPMLDELYELLETHRLEEWEAAEVVAKPLGLLYSCMEEGEARAREMIYPRLAKLDPILAMELTRDRGTGGHSSPSTPGPPPDDSEEEP